MKKAVSSGIYSTTAILLQRIEYLCASNTLRNSLSNKPILKALTIETYKNSTRIRRISLTKENAPFID